MTTPTTPTTPTAKLNAKAWAALAHVDRLNAPFERYTIECRALHGLADAGLIAAVDAATLAEVHAGLRAQIETALADAQRALVDRDFAEVKRLMGDVEYSQGLIDAATDEEDDSPMFYVITDAGRELAYRKRERAARKAARTAGENA